jgi:predicted metalloprotease
MNMRFMLKSLSCLLIVFILTTAATPTAGTAGNAKPSAAADMPLPELLEVGNRSIEHFWRETSASLGLRYIRSPRLISAPNGTGTPCGTVQDAFYCQRNNTIYYDYDSMKKVYTDTGDFAVVTILAHEWGHSVQAQLVPGWETLPGYVIEQQADCFAGAFASAADDWGMLERDDMDEGMESLYLAGDAKGKLPLNLGFYGHGTPFKRVSVFLYGYNTDARTCFCECIDKSLREYYNKG